jgi:DNA-binding XRE family transcriptional regulator
MFPIRETYHGVKIEEFLAHTNIEENTDCLIWHGPKDRYGHPFMLARSDTHPTLKAPRCAVRLCAGFMGVSILPGTRIRMTCHNPLCVDPGHIGCTKTVEKANAARGERHGRAKFTDAQVQLIRARAQAGAKQADLAREFGMSQQHVSEIVRDRSRQPQKRVRLNIW